MSGYQQIGSIRDAINKIHKHEYVLPAIQRGFVWDSGRVEKLFDSLMRGYPFGTLLLWKTKPQKEANFQFYDFITNWHERDKYKNDKIPQATPGQEVFAVMDGQQRLTALNIGLRGSMAKKKPHARWNKDDAFPKRFLYLDLFSTIGEDLETRDEMEEAGEEYRFRFLTSEEVEKFSQNSASLWFKVADIWSMEKNNEVNKWIRAKRFDNETKEDRASEVLSLLWETIHVTSPNFYAYREESNDIDRIVEVFDRVNSQGQPLSKIDLIFTKLVSQWREVDAREEIESLIEKLNKISESNRFNKDFVIQAGLLVGKATSQQLKRRDVTPNLCQEMQDNWDKIKKTLILTVRLAKEFGYSDNRINSLNALLPLFQYLYMSDKDDKILLLGEENKKDREKMRLFLFTSILKGLWSGSSNTVVAILRNVLNETAAMKFVTGFPLQELHQALGKSNKSISFSRLDIAGDEESLGIFQHRYGSSEAFMLLSLLTPSLDTEKFFHVDHIFPQKIMKKSEFEKIGFTGEEAKELVGWMNQLCNLQLLSDQENQKKSGKMPQEWLKKMTNEEKKIFIQRGMLGDIPDKLDGFREWALSRDKEIVERLCQILGVKD